MVLFMNDETKNELHKKAMTYADKEIAKIERYKRDLEKPMRNRLSIRFIRHRLFCRRGLHVWKRYPTSYLWVWEECKVCGTGRNGKR